MVMIVRKKENYTYVLTSSSPGACTPVSYGISISGCGKATAANNISESFTLVLQLYELLVAEREGPEELYEAVEQHLYGGKAKIIRLSDYTGSPFTA